jgi:hypothetical protein
MTLPVLLASATLSLSAPQVPPAPPVPSPPVAPAAPAVPAAPVAGIAPVPQTPLAAPAPPTLPVPQAPPAPLPEPARVLRTPAPPPPPGKPGQNVNIQIELTITESGGAAPETKLVSMLASDANWGRVRSQGSARPNADVGFDAVVLNVDARPTILGPDSLRLELTVEYVPPMAEAGTAADIRRAARLHQSLNVILKNGQSLQVSRAVDPVSRRTTTVDVKATRLP